MKLLDPSNKAYWVPVPMDHLAAIGAVVAQWGQFEMQFSGFIKFLSRDPKTAELASKIPRAFGEKAKLLKKLALVVFPDTPILTEKIGKFAERSQELCLKRNAIIHGFWFDMTPFDGREGVTLMTEPDGTGDFYSIALDQLEALAQKIGELRSEGIFLLFRPLADAFPFPTSPELSALQEYNRRFPGDGSETSILRDPKRKGTPQRGDPFRA
jgi:hypothetical protein